jgi:hypothetical protein
MDADEVVTKLRQGLGGAWVSVHGVRALSRRESQAHMAVPVGLYFGFQRRHSRECGHRGRTRHLDEKKVRRCDVAGDYKEVFARISSCVAGVRQLAAALGTDQPYSESQT